VRALKEGSCKCARTQVRRANRAALTHLRLLCPTPLPSYSSASDEQHVPYRDSSLTRLLQPSLSGNALTAMLACVSPAVDNHCMSLSTLKFARVALTVQSRPVLAATTDIVNTDPMAADCHDPDTVTDRRAIVIDVPGWGEVFARCCGDASAPLILWVHGSGPVSA